VSVDEELKNIFRLFKEQADQSSRLSEQNAHHIKILNGEMGETRDKMSDLSVKVVTHYEKIKNDLDWVKRIIFGVGAVLGLGVVTVVADLILRALTHA